MSLEGHVEIVLPRDPSGPVGVDLKEPADVTGLLTGRTPQEVIRLIPALYSLCGTAHAAASAQALEAAAERQVDGDVRRRRAALVLMERAREHILRVALDWPRHLGEPDDVEMAQAALPLLSAFRTALDPAGTIFLDHVSGEFGDKEAQASIQAATVLAEERVFGESLTDWSCRRDLGAIKAWSGAGRTLAARFIAMLLTEDRIGLGSVHAAFLSDNGPDVHEPDELAAPVPETSPLDRCRPHAALNGKMPDLATRYLARLIDLGQTLADLAALRVTDTELAADDRGAKPKGVGVSETARGRLTHLATLKEGVVDRYAIVSPTRWNFADEGVAVRCLRTLPGGTEEERTELAELVIGAIDPCVAHHVRIA